MRLVLITALVSLTSVAAGLVGVRRFGLSPGDLRPALGRALDCLGATAIFLAVNVLAGMAATLLLRGTTGRFFSLYVASDLTLVGLSLLQGLVFEWWRERGRRVTSPR